ncbi:MAG: nitrogen fixation protein NifQ [Hyphomicrobiales bacterium]
MTGPGAGLAAGGLTLHQALQQRLMRMGRGGLNEVFVAQMLASWMAGRGVLPSAMGLDPSLFRQMLDWHFPGIGPFDDRRAGVAALPRPDELDDVRMLLDSHRAGRSISELWMTEIVALGCMGGDHLWSDLGLFSRDQLSALMMLNFPTLAAANSRNMKWKRFLYKQLCEAEGVHACRAPSCEACADYGNCFVPAEAE